MKDNNFDFIKDKFDNSGVNAPGEIDGQFVLDHLENDIPQLNLLPPKQSKKKAAFGISAVAAAAVATACTLTFTGVFGSVKPAEQKNLKAPASNAASLRGFTSRDELKSELKNVIKVSSYLGNTSIDYYLEDYYADGAANSSGSMSGGSSGSSSNSSSGSSSGNKVFDSGSSAASSYHNDTYVQSVGVEEADTVKTTDKNIFYLNGNVIEVFSAEGKNSKKVAEIKALNLDESQNDGAGYAYVNDFYIFGGRLITLSTEHTSSRISCKTVADIFDISDVNDIKRVDSFFQSGRYTSSRMIGGALYIVSDSAVSNDRDIPTAGRKVSSTADSIESSEIPLEDIYSVQKPCTSSFLVVSMINTEDSAQAAKTKAILGSADIVYCNLDNLYVTALEYSPKVYDEVFPNASQESNADEDETEAATESGEEFSTDSGGFFYHSGSYPEDDKTDDMYSYAYYQPEQTQIIKIDLKDGIEFVASGSVKGAVNNQYALDEYNGNLRVATTSYDNNYVDRNNLFVLDKDLKQIGEVTDFAEDEHIEAVRYINDTAYVITYRQTDPLFVIDLSNPSKPEIKGFVKISGFSTMLVPVDENIILGIGYHTEEASDEPIDINLNNALKIVTFDVTDKANPKVLDTKIFTDYSSAVQYNPKALLVNFERNDYTIPMNYFKWGEYDYSTQTYNDYKAPETKCGSLNFRVDNGKITVIDDYTSDVIKGEYSTVDRCVYIGGNIYLLGSENPYIAYDSIDYNSYSTDTIIDSVPYK